MLTMFKSTRSFSHGMLQIVSGFVSNQISDSNTSPLDISATGHQSVPYQRTIAPVLADTLHEVSPH